MQLINCLLQPFLLLQKTLGKKRKAFLPKNPGEKTKSLFTEKAWGKNEKPFYRKSLGKAPFFLWEKNPREKLHHFFFLFFSSCLTFVFPVFFFLSV